MNKIYRLSIITFLLMTNSLLSQDPIELPDDSLSIGVFFSNLHTGVFKGATIINEPISAILDTNGLPLEVHFHPPLDFGSILFQNLGTGDTLFHATMVWMGLGHIIQPIELISPDSFLTGDQSYSIPDTSIYWYLGPWDSVSDFGFLPEWEEMADSISQNLSNLQVMDQFSEFPYSALYFAYLPSATEYTYDEDMMVLFTFRNPSTSTVHPPPIVSPQNPRLEPLFPNPCNSSFTKNFDLPQASTVEYSIYDVHGRRIFHSSKEMFSSGQHRIHYHFENMPSGIYRFALSIGQNNNYVENIVYLK